MRIFSFNFKSIQVGVPQIRGKTLCRQALTTCNQILTNVDAVLYRFKKKDAQGGLIAILDLNMDADGKCQIVVLEYVKRTPFLAIYITEEEARSIIAGEDPFAFFEQRKGYVFAEKGGIPPKKTHVELTYEGFYLDDVSRNATELELFVSLFGIKDIQKVQGLDQLTKLRKLDLGGTRSIIRPDRSPGWIWQGGGISEMKGLEALVNLRELDLKGNHITEISGLDTLRKLEVLYLTYNNISEIKGLENLVNLKRLWLDHNDIREIKGLATLTHLEQLNLSNNQIMEISGLENLGNLTDLALNKNRIHQIKGFENLTKLAQLSLEENPIPRDVFNVEISGLDEYGNARHPLDFVEYCRAQKALPPLGTGVRQERMQPSKTVAPLDLNRSPINSEFGIAFTTVSFILQTPLTEWFDKRGILRFEEGEPPLPFSRIFPSAPQGNKSFPKCLKEVFDSSTFLAEHVERAEFRHFLYIIANETDAMEVLTSDNKIGAPLNYLRQRLPTAFQARIDRHWRSWEWGCLVFTPREFREQVFPVMARIIDAKYGKDEEDTNIDPSAMDELEDMCSFALAFAGKHEDAFMLLFRH